MAKSDYTFKDFMRTMQDHNRNEALRDQARAAKERAEQARLDREDNERHRRHLEEIREREVDIQASQLEFAKEQAKADKIAKAESDKVYALYRKKDEIAAIGDPLQKFFEIQKWKDELQKIQIDLVKTITYRDRYYKTLDLAAKELVKLQKVIEPDLWEVLAQYEDLRLEQDFFLTQESHSWNELTGIHDLVERISDFRGKVGKVSGLHSKALQNIAYEIINRVRQICVTSTLLNFPISDMPDELKKKLQEAFSWTDQDWINANENFLETQEISTEEAQKICNAPLLSRAALRKRLKKVDIFQLGIPFCAAL